VTSAPLTTVTTLSGLPAGAYLVWATVSEEALDDSVYLLCDFVTGGGQKLQPETELFSVENDSAIQQSNAGTNSSTQAGAVTFASTGSLSIKCLASDVSQTVQAFANITALKVDQLN
jgi:hypothetical protein